MRLLPDGPVEIKIGDTHWATITAGRSRTRIAGMSCESFPELPTGTEAVCKFPLAVFTRMIQRTLFAISMEESRFTLNGALFEIGPTGYLKVIATDGHRLALAEAAGEAKKASRALIPKKALLELVRLAGIAGADATVEFATDENHLFFAVGDRLLIARRLSGNFPDYNRVLPKSFTGSATVNRQGFKDALNRVRTFAADRSRAVKLTIGDGQIGIFGSAIESGESEETIAAEVTGSAVVGFNADYLLDFLGAADTENVVLQFKDEKSSLQLTQPGDMQYVCIVMPLRV